MNKKNKIQTSTSRKVFMICDYALLFLITLICIYPFWYIIIYTFSEGSQVDVNPPVFLPRGFTLSNYKDIFEKNKNVPILFAQEVFYKIID